MDSDRSLIRACLAGERQAWENLIRRYQRLLYAIPRRCGLSEDGRALLEPFHRTAEAAHLRPGGAGLGLAVVRAIVEAHTGHLGITNRPGGGVCVWVAFPAGGQLLACFLDPEPRQVRPVVSEHDRARLGIVLFGGHDRAGSSARVR